MKLPPCLVPIVYQYVGWWCDHCSKHEIRDYLDFLDNIEELLVKEVGEDYQSTDFQDYQMTVSSFVYLCNQCEQFYCSKCQSLCDWCEWGTNNSACTPLTEDTRCPDCSVRFLQVEEGYSQYLCTTCYKNNW